MGPGENNSPRLKEPKFGRLNFRFTVTTFWPILNQNSTGQQKKQKKTCPLANTNESAPCNEIWLDENGVKMQVSEKSRHYQCSNFSGSLVVPIPFMGSAGGSTLDKNKHKFGQTWVEGP